MKPILLACLAVGILLLGAACGSNTVVPASSISIYRVNPEVPISTNRQRGSISINAGDDFQILVKRLTNDDSGTHTSDVTTVCTYKFSQAGLATANSLGVIHGLAPGFTSLEVKLRPSASDPVDICYLDITVNP
jgi:hypothetical protein